jgi:type IV pilus assembly protein PilN
MIRINLIPTKAARKKEGAILQLVTGAIAIGIALVVCWWINRDIEKKIQAEQLVQAELNAKINQLQSIIAEVEDYKKKQRDLEAKINTIKDLNEKRSGPVKFLDEFTTVLPRKAWVTNFRETDKQLTLEGAAIDGASVSDFIDSLRSSRFFYNVQLIQVQQASEQGKKVQRFNITCLVNYVPAGKMS